MAVTFCRKQNLLAENQAGECAALISSEQRGWLSAALA